ncbi:MAG: hypothetical protein ACJ79G_08890 [Myxococcales bacterium]
MIALLALALHIAADPAHLQLGEGKEARVIVQLPEGATGLRLSTNAGSIGAPAAQADGTYAATYTPPDESIPQVAIVSAVAQTREGPEAAFVALPLWGQGDAVVKTRPRASIQVSIGDRTFGPAKADETGTALVPVVVPPGIAAARHGTRDIDLHIPPQRRVQVVLGAESVLADRETRTDVFVFEVDPAGSPARSPSFQLRSTQGSIGDVEPLGPGMWKARWTLPAGSAGRARVVALAGGADLDAASDLAVVAGSAARVDLAADRSSVRAGEQGIGFTARAFDGAGNPSIEPLRFVTRPGTVEARTSGGGVWSLRVAVPAEFGGRDSLEIDAVSPSSGQLAGKAKVALVPGDPVAARARSVPPTRADGVSEARVRFSVADRYGNPVSTLEPSASADRGSVNRVVPVGHGEYEAIYVPRASRLAGDALVTIDAGRAQARARVPLLPQLPALAVSPRMGAITNLADLSSPLVGVEVAYRSDRLGPKLFFSGDLSYWFSREDASFAVDSARPVATHSRTEFLTLATSIGMRLDVAERTRLFLSGGPALTHLWSQFTVSGQPTSYDTVTVLGAQVAAGAERAMWGGVPFLEARFGFFADPALSGVVSGPLRIFSLAAGYRFEML